MERAATPAELLSWRFQQGLYRAYYDAYVRRRLIYETDLYNQAIDKLEEIHAVGSQPVAPCACGTSRRGAAPTGWTLRWSWRRRNRFWPRRSRSRWRRKSAPALSRSPKGCSRVFACSYRVERYQAEGVERGGNLDTVDAPVTNGPWLAKRLREISSLPSAGDQVQAIEEVLNRTNPGPGGFYDDLGDIARPSRLVRGLGSVEDPELRKSVLIGHRFPTPTEMPLAWKRWAEALFEAPLRLHYPELDPEAQYKVRVVYAGDAPRIKIRLACEGGPEIHPLIAKPQPPAPLEFDIPREATAVGELTLAWTREPGLGGNGRGAQVAEVWLLKR